MSHTLSWGLAVGSFFGAIAFGYLLGWLVGRSLTAAEQRALRAMWAEDTDLT